MQYVVYSIVSIFNGIVLFRYLNGAKTLKTF